MSFSKLWFDEASDGARMPPHLIPGKRMTSWDVCSVPSNVRVLEIGHPCQNGLVFGLSHTRASSTTLRYISTERTVRESRGVSLKCVALDANVIISGVSRRHSYMQREKCRRPGLVPNSGVHYYNRLTTRSARPFSPSTTLSLPLVATFSRTSSSRSRISVGLSASTFAVLA